jgi:Dynamin family
MQELSDYQQRRLDLGDMLRALLHLAHRYGDEQREQEIRTLLTRLASGRFQLAVAGQFSRGKSTLMNALLGNAYLPMGALPMTSVVTTIRYGSRPRALVRSSASGLPIEVPVAEVARFVARQSAERTRMHVASVEVELPAELLRLGFEFVDTPGVGSAIAANTATTLRYLPQADAVIFVTGFDSPLTEAEAEFLTTVAGQAGKLFLVINKRDLVPAADAAEVARFVRQWARDNLRVTEAAVFGLSALNALSGAVDGDDDLLAGSGIGAFRIALTQFLTAEQGRLALRNAANAAARLVSWQQRDLHAGRLPADGGQEPDAVAAAFDRRISELMARQRLVADRIADRAATEVRRLITDRGPGWQDELRASVAAAAGLAPPGDPDPAGELLDAGTAVIDAAARAKTPGWLERRAGEIHEALISGSASDITALLESARSPRDVGAVIGGLPASDDGQRGGGSADELPPLAVPVIEWSTPERGASHRPRLGRRGSAPDARGVLEETLTAAVERFTRQASDALTHASVRWAAALGDRAEQLAIAEAAQVRRYLQTTPADGDVAVLDDLGSRIANFVADLDEWHPGAEGEGEQAAPDGRAGVTPTASSGQCAVCRQLETVLTEHMIREQFLLATSEGEQARHADAGGFCPLHTWQYAQMATPLGISAGYARLADAVADALDDLGSRAPSAGELAREVADLAHVGACPVCAALADAEQRAVAEVAVHEPPSPVAAQLCLRHLAQVLAAGPSEAAARAMAAALAAELRRTSQDMRAYALKREALRRGLITDQEAQAYAETLRLLAGRPSLVQPWSEVSTR